MLEQQNYEWFEELVPECPPKGAFSVNNVIYYRLGKNPPHEDDFISHRFLHPDKVFQVSECQARSLSIFDSLEAAEKNNKLPALRKKNLSVVAVTLTEISGLIQQTGDNPHHYSWWRSKAFDIQNCQVI